MTSISSTVRSQALPPGDELRFQGPLGTIFARLAHSQVLGCETELRVGRIFSEYEPERAIHALEIGCGSGATTVLMLAGVPGVFTGHPRATMRAIDNDAALLQSASEWLRPLLDAGRVELVENHALDELRRTATSSLDAVVSAFAIHNFPREYRAAVLEECFRVLRPGGLFLNGDKYAQDDAAAHQSALDWQRAKFEALHAGDPVGLEAWLRHNEEDEHESRKMFEGESLDAMRALGFESPRIVFREHTEAVCVATKPR